MTTRTRHDERDIRAAAEEHFGLRTAADRFVERVVHHKFRRLLGENMAEQGRLIGAQSSMLSDPGYDHGELLELQARITITFAEHDRLMQAAFPATDGE